MDSDWKAGEVRSSCSGIQPMMVLGEDEENKKGKRDALEVDARVSGESEVRGGERWRQERTIQESHSHP